ncbi:hypothetical protein [Antarcticimicrobium sediminis]|uniref:Uncharacterized protein n=1 Tax=Antarcticimicrobium sediminis TaxID=2546227 RepID=A0A4R5ENE8_9RHOB|nr:hypothetical protein [Antarcticimicrobium sediminis]TDE36249.1 hypothetical protein E1B25_15150 [Antarcticimicrobium sediminis]
MATPATPSPARAGLWYFPIIFACGAVLGTLRTLVLTPALGPLRAVALELPVILALSWIVAGSLTRGRPSLSNASARLWMGAIALALLLVAECALALGFGQTPMGWLAGLITPQGLLGLAGQAVFALLPWLRYEIGRG